MKLCIKAQQICIHFCFMMVAMFVFTSISFAATPVNKNLSGVAIKGYDTVAYFTQQKPVIGMKEYSHTWMGAICLLSSKENKELFIQNPNKYASQYGGFCAYAVSQGGKAQIDPKAWTVYKDKLYLNYSLAVRDKKWLPNRDALIIQADKNWPTFQ